MRYRQRTSPNIESNLLNLGCGLNSPPNWLNVDGSLQAAFARRPKLKRFLVGVGVYPRNQANISWSANILRLDLRKPLPFPDNRFAAVYSSHTLEHLYHEQAVSLLKECFRVLKPDGVCRIVVPDLAATIERYLLASQGEDAESANKFMDDLHVHPRAPHTGLIGWYQRLFAYHQHKWMYDAKSLRMLMQEIGFKDVMKQPSLAGRLQGLQEVEDPERILDGAGVAIEGVKP